MILIQLPIIYYTNKCLNKCIRLRGLKIFSELVETISNKTLYHLNFIKYHFANQTIRHESGKTTCSRHLRASLPTLPATPSRQFNPLRVALDLLHLTLIFISLNDAL